jgi:hypothetical protein
MPRGGWLGGGRPPGSKNKKPARTVVKWLRFTPAEWSEVERRAAAAGVEVCEWQRDVLLREDV